MGNHQLWKPLVIGAALCLGSSATQATVITATEGSYFDGMDFQTYDAIPVDSRKILANATDMDANTFYALGVGGEITVDLSPNTFHEQIGTIEFTFGNVRSLFPESAKVFVTGPGGKQLKGELFNKGDEGSALTYFGPDIVTQSFGDVIGFLIPVPEDTFKVALKDTTFRNFSATYESTGRASDGFDVAELTFASVPEPASMVLLSLLLTGIAIVPSRARFPRE